MEIVVTGIFILVIFGAVNSIFNRVKQHQIIKKFNELARILDQENKEILTKDFLYFFSKNINLPQEEYFEKELDQFVNLYSENYKEHVSTKNIFLAWISILENNILHTPDKNLSVKEYQSAYETENKNIFEKIENQYKKDNVNNINNTSNKKRLFYLRTSNSIELFLNKYAKESDGLLPFYWFPFSSVFLKNISKLDYKGWFIIKKYLNL